MENCCTKNAIVVGDHWERTYGDVSWQPVNPNKKITLVLC